MTTSLKVRIIKTSKYNLNKFVFISLYFLGTNIKNRSVYAYIYQKLYLVKNFKSNLLVSKSILTIKRVVIGFANKIAMILSYQVIISITIMARSQSVKRKIFANKLLTIPPKFEDLI